MKTFYLTDSGRVREHNEDNLIIVKNKNFGKLNSKKIY